MKPDCHEGDSFNAFRCRNGILLAVLIFVFLANGRAEPVQPDSADAVAPPANEVYGRLDVEFLNIPSKELEHFKELFDEGKGADLAGFLAKSGSKVVASASTGIRTDGGEAEILIESGELTLQPDLASSGQLFISGKFDGKFGGSFDSPIRPGRHQLLMLLDQPASSDDDGYFNAIVARMPAIHWIKAASEDVSPVTGNIPSQGETDAGSSGDERPPAFPPPVEFGQILYSNHGDNLEGFQEKFDNTHFVVQDKQIVGHNGGGWVALPVSFTGDARIDFDVYTDSKDAGAFLILYDDGTMKGINVVDCPEQTFNGQNIVENISDLLDHQKFYYNFNTLATEPSREFPNRKWVHVTITKKGHELIDKVGDQVVKADISSANLPDRTHVGLGYYSTTTLGGNGLLKYANIRVIQLPGQ